MGEQYRIGCQHPNILREIYPQAAITLSAYEHITESESADAVINAFQETAYTIKNRHLYTK